MLKQEIFIICMKKNYQELPEFYIKKIHQYIQKDVNFQNDKVPFTACITCCSQLGKFGESCSKPVPILYNFESILVKPSTRFSPTCDCLLCKIPKLKLKEKYLVSKPQDSTPKGGQQQPSLTAEKKWLLLTSYQLLTNTKCLSVIGYGISHRCTPGTRHGYLRRMEEADSVGAEQLASSSLSPKKHLQMVL